MIMWFVALWWALFGGPWHRTTLPVHIGATEDWSPALAVLQAGEEDTAEPAPDWDTNVWTVDLHGEFNRLMDNFHADVEHIWGRFYEWLGVDGRAAVDLLAVAA